MDKSEWISEGELAKRLAKSYYLRTGWQLDPEVFLVEIQRKFNPNHDPDDGRFTFAAGGAAGSRHGAGRATSSQTGSGDWSAKPIGINPDRRTHGKNSAAPMSRGGISRSSTTHPAQKPNTNDRGGTAGRNQQTASERDSANIRLTFGSGRPEKLDISTPRGRPHIDLSAGDSATSFGLKQVGAGTYRQLSENPHAVGRSVPITHGIHRPKCNAFVYDALNWAGAAPSRMQGGRIPVAHEWGSRSANIGYYPVVAELTIPRTGVSPIMRSRLHEGDVISDGKHVGLVTLRNGSPLTVSAVPAWWFNRDLNSDLPAAGGVVRNDWGFRPGQRVVVRRFHAKSISGQGN